MVSEVISYRGKSALREVGKVFGLSLEQIDRLSAVVTHWDSADAAVPERLRDAGFDANDERIRMVLTMAKAINNASIPMGAVAASRTIHDTVVGNGAPGAIELFHGYTYSAHPAAAAAAVVERSAVTANSLSICSIDLPRVSMPRK